MILADKIIEERKRMGWSQEELADKLDVSRQSVSKWEGAQSVPDINRIIMMAELFGVSTDYLLKDEVTKEESNDYSAENEGNVRKLRVVTMEEASEFIDKRKKYAPLVALAAALCVLSPVVLLLLSGMSQVSGFGISETLAAGIGVVTLLVMIAIAVMIFVRTGFELKDYEFLQKAGIETAYGVSGMARERRKKLESKFYTNVITGIILCILSSVPLIITALITENVHVITSMVCVLLAMVAIAVYLFITVGMVKDGYDMLLEEGAYSPEKKKASPVFNKVSRIYWMTVTAAFLATSFITNDWGRTWIIWPVAAVLFAVVKTVVNIITKTDD